MLGPFLRRLNLGMLLTLAALATGAAFIGMERAGALFRSAPLAVFFVLGLLLAFSAFPVFPRLRRSPGRLLLHMGWMCILVGGLWNSERGRVLARGGAWPSVPLKSYLVIDEGGVASEVRADSDGPPVARLPFAVGLEEFRVESWSPEELAGIPDPDRAPPKQYTSRVRFMSPDAPPDETVIQVNRPALHRGYRFYQYAFDLHPTRTILLVVADEGWPVAAAGLVLLALGTCWTCWGRTTRGAVAPEEASSCM